MKVWNATQLDMLTRNKQLSWYEIKNQVEGSTEVMIYDSIGEYGVTAKDFVRDIDGIDGDLTLRLNTEGGEVFDGLAIYNALKQRKGKVTCVVDSLAASIGSVIAMAADRVVMAKNARFMIHEAAGIAMGDAKAMSKMAALLDDASENIAGIYAERTGTEPEEWRERMREESWIGAEEALELGMADEIQAPRAGQRLAPQNSGDLPVDRTKDAKASDKIDLTGFDPEEFRRAMKEATGD